MTRSILSALSLLGLTLTVGCTGTNPDCTSCNQSVGSDQDTTTACDACGDDTGSDPPAMGSFTAPQVALPDGSLEDCTSNLISTNTYSVPSGTTEDVAADEYDLTFGDFALADENSDGLPIHTASDGSYWIFPAQATSVEADKATAPEAPTGSRYVGGQTWTCNDASSSDESTSQTFVVSYTDDGSGQLQIVFAIGTFGISGNTLFYYEDGGCQDDGVFLNDTQVTIDAVCPFGDNTSECWKGAFEDRPFDW